MHRASPECNARFPFLNEHTLVDGLSFAEISRYISPGVRMPSYFPHPRRIIDAKIYRIEEGNFARGGKSSSLYSFFSVDGNYCELPSPIFNSSRSNFSRRGGWIGGRNVPARKSNPSRNEDGSVSSIIIESVHARSSAYIPWLGRKIDADRSSLIRSDDSTIQPTFP